MSWKKRRDLTVFCESVYIQLHYLSVLDMDISSLHTYIDNYLPSDTPRLSMGLKAFTYKFQNKQSTKLPLCDPESQYSRFLTFIKSIVLGVTQPNRDKTSIKSLDNYHRQLRS